MGGAAELEPGEVFVGRYEIRRLLGEGDRKRTYLALDEKMDWLVAISFVKPEAALDDPEGTKREAKVLGRIGRHANIVRCTTTTETQTAPSSTWYSYLLPGQRLIIRLTTKPGPRRRVALSYTTITIRDNCRGANAYIVAILCSLPGQVQDTLPEMGEELSEFSSGDNDPVFRGKSRDNRLADQPVIVADQLRRLPKSSQNRSLEMVSLRGVRAKNESIQLARWIDSRITERPTSMKKMYYI